MTHQTKAQILETLDNAYRVLAIRIKLGALNAYTHEQMQVIPRQLSEEFRNHKLNFFEIVYGIAERINPEDKNTLLEFYWITCYDAWKTPIEVLPRLQPAIQDAKEWWVTNYDKRRSC